ncbi:hypothetical protein AAZV13_03G053600 [Glycine max]
MFFGVFHRIWNHEEATLLNTFGNHDFPDRGISKLCLVNELDDSLLLDASFDGNIQIWKDYLLKGKQKLVIAFSSIHAHKPGVRSLSAVVDWQQQCDYPVCGCSLIIFGNVGYLPLPQCPKILTNCFLIL